MPWKLILLYQEFGAFQNQKVTVPSMCQQIFTLRIGCFFDQSATSLLFLLIESKFFLL